MKTFESFLDYIKFVALVRNTNRYRFYSWGESFLDTLLSTSESRKITIPKNTVLWRSQLGISEPRKVVWEEGVYDDTNPYPYPTERMKPQIGMAPEGRVNPKGIPYLYLSTDRETAMAECRPWLQSHISLGRFLTTRGLTIIDFSKDTYMPVYPRDFRIEESSDPDLIEKSIWAQINQAFTIPVSHSDFKADYAPTQVIAEFFKSKEFDGIKYKTALAKGHNIALFDLNDAEMTHCYLFRAEEISYSFEAVKDVYYATPLGKHLDNPQATEEFMNRIRKATKNSYRAGTADKNNDKT